MNLFAANIFDNPLLLIIVLVVSALANWLMKKRQESEIPEEPDRHVSRRPPDESRRPVHPPDLEQTLRRLLGEEIPSRTPPPIPHPPRAEPTQVHPWHEQSSEWTWAGEAEPSQETPAPMVQQAPVFHGPDAARGAAGAVRTDALDLREKAARHLVRPGEEVRPARSVTESRRGRRSRGAYSVSQWRDTKSVRRAFVASLVFGPPKGLES